MKELNLQEIRQQLDVIDASLTELFETRMELCREVAEYKIQTGKPVYDREREQQKLKAVTALAHSDFTRKGTYELFSQIMTISRRLQYGLLASHGQEMDTGFSMIEDLKRENVRIVYQGVEGLWTRCGPPVFRPGCGYVPCKDHGGCHDRGGGGPGRLCGAPY